MKKIIAFLILVPMFWSCKDADKTPMKSMDDKSMDAAAPVKETPATEIADDKYMEVGKKGLASMTSGDIDAWTSPYADNAVYLWNNGDSIAGKSAILEYWKKRRTEVIDSISFSNDIWLAVKVNKPQNVYHAPGTWLLGWYMVNTKYKTGKRMGQWIHTAMHFDASDKIDRVLQFIDRAPINAAMAKGTMMKSK